MDTFGVLSFVAPAFAGKLAEGKIKVSSCSQMFNSDNPHQIPQTCQFLIGWVTNTNLLICHTPPFVTALWYQTELTTQYPTPSKIECHNWTIHVTCQYWEHIFIVIELLQWFRKECVRVLSFCVMDGIGSQSPPIIDESSVQITYKEYRLSSNSGGTTIHNYPPSTFYLIISATPGGSHPCDPRIYSNNPMKFSSQSTPWQRVISIWATEQKLRSAPLMFIQRGW